MSHVPYERVMSHVHKQVFKGAVLEVEYLPSADKNDSMQLISEFIEVYCYPDGPTAVPVSSG